MTTAPRRFAPSGPLALDPKAFGLPILTPFDAPPPVAREGVALVHVRGPLDHHASVWSDSYDAILERFDAALEMKPAAVMLAIDSPGGVMFGCLATGRRLRARAEAAGVPLFAFVEGSATSAAYALAAAGSRIFAAHESIVGSIGVIDALVDGTAADRAAGVRVELVTSGARKADGNPHIEVTSDARAARQAHVDDLAGQFFDYVETMRGIPASKVRAFEAATFVGPRGLEAGLVDKLCSLDEAIAIAGSTRSRVSGPPAATRASVPVGPMAISPAIGSPAVPARPAPPRAAVQPPRAARAEAPPPAPPVRPPAAPSVSKADLDALEQRVDALAADREERAQLRASRPDLAEDPKLAALMASAPLEAVRKLVREHPRAAPARPLPEGVAVTASSVTFSTSPSPAPAEAKRASELREQNFRSSLAQAFGLPISPPAAAGFDLRLSATHAKRPGPVPVPRPPRPPGLAPLAPLALARIEAAMGIRPRELAVVDGNDLRLGVPHRAPRPPMTAPEARLAPDVERRIVEAFGLTPRAEASNVSPLVLRIDPR